MAQENEPVYVNVPGYTSSYCRSRVSDMCNALEDMVYNIGKYMNMDFDNALLKNDMIVKAQIMAIKCEALKSRLSGISFE